jgi:hypothetical protein
LTTGSCKWLYQLLGNPTYSKGKSGERGAGQDRGREALVAAKPFPPRGDAALLGQKIIGTIDQSFVLGRHAGQAKCRLDEQRGGHVRSAVVGIAPTAIQVLPLGEPMQALDDQLAQIALHHVLQRRALRRRHFQSATAVGHDQRAHGGGGGEWRTSELTDPVAADRPFGQQFGADRLMRSDQSLAVDAQTQIRRSHRGWMHQMRTVAARPRR